MVDYVLKAKEILAVSLKVPVETIADDATLGDLAQLDSLSFETTILGIEASLGHRMDTVALLSIRSVQDIARILERG